VVEPLIKRFKKFALFPNIFVEKRFVEVAFVVVELVTTDPPNVRLVKLPFVANIFVLVAFVVVEFVAIRFVVVALVAVKFVEVSAPTEMLLEMIEFRLDTAALKLVVKKFVVDALSAFMFVE
jgi:hypothetical protein